MYDSSVPYHARDRRGGRQQQPQGINGAGQKDSMAEFQDQFSKIADSKSLRGVVSGLALIVRAVVCSWKENLQLIIHEGQS